MVRRGLGVLGTFGPAPGFAVSGAAGELVDAVGEAGIGAADEAVALVAVGQAFELGFQAAGGDVPGRVVAGEGLQGLEELFGAEFEAVVRGCAEECGDLPLPEAGFAGLAAGEVVEVEAVRGAAVAASAANLHQKRALSGWWARYSMQAKTWTPSMSTPSVQPSNWAALSSLPRSAASSSTWEAAPAW